MKKVLTLLSIVTFSILCAFPGFTETTPPAKGGALPEITLSVPSAPDLQNYLGVTGKETFTIPQINAEVVVIEIYSLYCPFCQAEAPAINELYQQIQGNGKLKDKIKLIGIGAGNSEFEVEEFKKIYDVKFPLFPDADLSIHKILGEVRTPYFIGVKINKDGTHTVIHSKLGSIKEKGADKKDSDKEAAARFLSLITELAGL
ncbi:MAG: TlpA family protein disulfide reductase [Deltaproteobacteria bacterium]|nr:TlpA family protein disulfide reductase [Deltaproteobacteria bacterium]